MIGFLCDPYDDEAFPSIVARTANLFGPVPYSHFIESLFGISSLSIVTDLPSRVDSLVASVLNIDMDADQVIDDHTLFPLLAAFRSKQERERIRGKMKYGGSPHLYSGLMATGCPFSSWLQFCPLCAAEDRSSIGETYWHRIHQVPGVTVCPFHKIRLQRSNAHNRSRSHQFFRRRRRNSKCVGDR
jgi:hypothetical protein